ncbi:unnamed protein product, partial [Agarophyton chilense]
FNDPMNINLGENVVSLITALTTSISLVFLVDIVYRTIVRARKGSVTKRVVLRRYLVDIYTNPIHLFSNLIGVFKRNPACEDVQGQQIQDFMPSSSVLARTTSKTGMQLTVFSFGLFTVFVEFLFIFLATKTEQGIRRAPEKCSLV